MKTHAHTIALIAIVIVMLNSQSIFAQNSSTEDQTTFLPLGEKAPEGRFTGQVFIYPMVTGNDQLDCQIANVTFEPGARTNWHRHPGGQALIVTEGEGYYQEKGKLKQLIHKGEVIKCPPGVEHWHGATPFCKLTHIAILTNAEKGDAIWLQKVADEEYNGK